MTERLPLTPADAEFCRRAFAGEAVDWTDPRLERIVRLRLLSDPGHPWWDVSYCVGRLRDGSPVRVTLPFDRLPKRFPGREVVSFAVRDGVHAKRLGALSAISTLE